MDHGEGFRRAWVALGATADADEVLAALRAAWAEPHRRYHTTEHLAEGLDLLEGLRHRLARPDEVTVAWWFHDAVYDPLAPDNEARSAAWAHEALTGAAEDARARVRDLVLATAAHDPEGGDAAVLVDVDLAVLGADPARYDRFERDVRAEYAAVPDEVWRAGRAAVLDRLVARRPLYTTPELARREARARANVARALAALAGP